MFLYSRLSLETPTRDGKYRSSFQFFRSIVMHIMSHHRHHQQYVSLSIPDQSQMTTLLSPETLQSTGQTILVVVCNSMMTCRKTIWYSIFLDPSTGNRWYCKMSWALSPWTVFSPPHIRPTLWLQYGNVYERADHYQVPLYGSSRARCQRERVRLFAFARSRKIALAVPALY